MHGEVSGSLFEERKFEGLGGAGLFLDEVLLGVWFGAVIFCPGTGVLPFREFRSHSYLSLAVIQKLFSYLMLVYFER